MPVMLTKSFRRSFFLQKGFKTFPRNYELAGFSIIHEPGVRINPLNFPLMSTDMADDANTLYRASCFRAFANSVLPARLNLGFQHGDKPSPEVAESVGCHQIQASRIPQTPWTAASPTQRGQQ